jgi:acetyltransferase-like isoleucine patch superfamily enzyme
MFSMRTFQKVISRLYVAIYGRTIVRLRWVRVRLYLWFQGVRFGRNLRAEGSLEVAKGDRITIGDNAKLGKDIYLGAFSSGELVIGSNTYVGRYTIILSHKSVRIGDDCLIAPGCHITDVNHGFRDPDKLIRQQEYPSREIVIEDDVWLGTGVSILPGVRIGKGSVIGARSVVTKDIPPYSIAVGVPAKVIQKRK